jgi:anti-repressor protein
VNEIQVFNSDIFGTVRTVEVDGAPYFVGKDVAEALGYSNASKAVSVHVDEEDRKLIMFTADSHNGNVVKTQTAIINESGVYALVFGSKLPTAKEFKHWVTSEILPTIRKHGAYMTEQTIEQALTSPDFLIKLATQLKEEKEKSARLEDTVNKQNELLERSKPLVCFANCVKAADTSILVGELAKILRQNGVEIGQKRLFEWLRSNGYLIKSGSDRNMPTQYSMERGLFEIKETVISHSDGHTSISKTPKVSGKGQICFINKLIEKAVN